MIKDGRRLTHYTLASHPFDVVGWDGMVYPYTFNADDFEPITGRIHQPPPVQQTFEAPGFVVCTFAPRMLDTDPEAIKVPYAHSNVQSDEVLVLCEGPFRQPARCRGRLIHAAPPRNSPRPASRHDRREQGRPLDGRAGRHGGYLQAAPVDPPGHQLDDPSYPMSWID